jgi:hypothetical protein
LVLRAGYCGYVYSRHISISSMDEYETIAINLVDHGRYDGLKDKPGPTAAREPAFPLFIAGIYEVVGKHPAAILLAHCLLNLLTCLLMAAMARDLFGPIAGDIVLAMGVFYPYFIFYTGYFYRETLLCFVLSCFFYATTRLVRDPRPGSAGAAGLCAGLCAVTLSTFFGVCLALCLWALAWFWRRSNGLVLAAAFFSAMAVLPALWVGRNLAVFHRLIPGSTLGGYNLYTALVVPEEFRGTDQEGVYEAKDSRWSTIVAMSPLMSDDGSQQAAFIEASKSYIKAHPGYYLRHVGRQAVKLWRFYPYPRKYSHSYVWIKTLSLLSDGWIIPLGLWGLFLFWKRSPQVPLFAVVIGSATGVYALVSAIVRYRLPLMIPLMILAAGVLSERLPAKAAR